MNANKNVTLAHLDLLPFDFHSLNHEIYSNSSPLSRWEKALQLQAKLII